jgi:hypothetical protein
MRWNKTSDIKPPDDAVVFTKIDDEHGVRNEGELRYYRNMWWTTDMKMYVYYVPTHWASIDEIDKIFHLGPTNEFDF